MACVRIGSKGVWLHRLGSALLCSSFMYHVHGVKSSPSGFCKKVSPTAGENFLKQKEEFGSILEVHILFRFIIYGRRKKMCLKCPALFGNISEGELAHNCHSPVPYWRSAIHQALAAEITGIMEEMKANTSTPTVSPPHSTLHLQLHNFPWGPMIIVFLSIREVVQLCKRKIGQRKCVCVFKEKQQWLRSLRFVPSRNSAVNWFTCNSSFQDFRPRERILVTQSGFEVSIQI